MFFPLRGKLLTTLSRSVINCELYLRDDELRLLESMDCELTLFFIFFYRLYFGETFGEHFGDLFFGDVDSIL